MRRLTRFNSIGAGLLALSLLAWAQGLRAQTASLPLAPPYPKPDARFKADILVIVAHPDDESGIDAWLARESFDRHRKIAWCFGTRGQAGGNEMGSEQRWALAMEREVEARDSALSLGIHNVWFLRGMDTFGNEDNVLHSLENWGHGRVLGEMVRAIRLTRPEVVVTWLPDEVVGENHEDHQASSVMATEAFDLAGDPTAFPEQAAAPRNYRGYANMTEGLRPWQPEKLYYFSDATRQGFLKRWGPTYSSLQVSPSQHRSYGWLAQVANSYYLTQIGHGLISRAAIRAHRLRHWFAQPVHLMLAKSYVGGSPTAPVFQNIVPGPIAFHKAPGYRALPRQGLSVEIGNPWHFYHQFWRAHGIAKMRKLLAPQVGVGAGSRYRLEVLLRNDSNRSAVISLRPKLPAGWKALRGAARYPLPAHSQYPVETLVQIGPAPMRIGRI